MEAEEDDVQGGKIWSVHLVMSSEAAWIYISLNNDNNEYNKVIEDRIGD